MMMLGIFFNNAFASILALLSGLGAGLIPLLFMLSNGMVIGIVLEMIIQGRRREGITLFLVGILPHGIFELPAVLISTAIGLKLGYSVIKSVLARKDLVIRRPDKRLAHILFLDIAHTIGSGDPGDLRDRALSGPFCPLAHILIAY